MTSVLVTGANGQLGIELGRVRWPDGWTVVRVGRDRLDLTDTAAIRRIVDVGHDGRPWDIVVNAAAYTAVDRAEQDQVTAWAVNALAPAAFGEVCARGNVPLLHVSTDYVFDGARSGAWQVDDPVAPLGVYGASKLGGEIAIRASRVRHAIVRTAWVVSPYGANFVKTMLRLAGERDRVGVVADQFGSPTNARDLAQALVIMTVRHVEDESAPNGVFHFSGAGSTSWAGFAEEIFRQSAARGGPSAVVEPITTADYPTPARRPANSVLNHDAIRAAYGIDPRGWSDALGDILDALIGRRQ